MYLAQIYKFTSHEKLRSRNLKKLIYSSLDCEITASAFATNTKARIGVDYKRRRNACGRPLIARVKSQRVKSTVRKIRERVSTVRQQSTVGADITKLEGV